jgi:hypothetical protein
MLHPSHSRPQIHHPEANAIVTELDSRRRLGFLLDPLGLAGEIVFLLWLGGGLDDDALDPTNQFAIAR